MDEQFLSRNGNVTPHYLLGWLGATARPAASLAQLLASHDYSLVPLQESAATSGVALVLVDCEGLEPESVQEHLLWLHAHHPDASIALLRVEPESLHEQFIRWHGVNGIFPADCSEQRLLQGVRAMLNGENWLPRRLLDRWLRRQRDRLPLFHVPSLAQKKPLTERERQILRHVGEASTNAQIAYDLSISEHTVKTHLYNIFRKIQVRNRTEACNWVRAHWHDSVL